MHDCISILLFRPNLACILELGATPTLRSEAAYISIRACRLVHTTIGPTVLPLNPGISNYP